MITLQINGLPVSVEEGTTLLEAARFLGFPIPTLCHVEGLSPYGACRLCVVEIGEGPQAKLVSSCTYPAQEGLKVRTASTRVVRARKMVLEFLGSSVDLSLTDQVAAWNAEYGADPSRYGDDAATVADQPVKVDNDLYVRDEAKCILCYQCVDACKHIKGR